jgi:hypothetical protein
LGPFFISVVMLACLEVCVFWVFELGGMLSQAFFA